jgi:tRNA (guanosine-2'-O-)-methyltransferase
MTDQKLISYLESFITPERKERFSRILQQRTRFLTVAMEDVFQLHNTSAVIRSCEIFGVQDAHIIEARFGKRLDKKISLGAQQWVDVYRYANSSDCISALRGKGYRLIGTTPDPGACPLHQFDLNAKTALFFGSEKEGLTAAISNEVDGFLQIPMVGFTESLNVSVAAAIFLYQLTADLRQSENPWQLTG